MKPASIAILLVLAALPLLAAPGAFTLSGSGQCNGSTPHIALTWSTSAGATSYDVWRNSVNIVTVTSGTAFDDTSVVPNGNYSYFLRATDGSSTVDSNTVVIQAPNCSPAPGAFTLTGNAFCYNAPPDQPPAGRRGAIHLSWPASSNATSYDVYRDGGVFAQIPTGGSYGVDDISPGLGGHHSYYVIAKNAAGTTQSNTVDVTIPSDVCQAPPGSFTLDGSASCDTTGPRVNVNLSWTAAGNATGYQILRNNSPLTSTAGTSYTDTTANPGQTYNYKVTATNSGGSTDSNTKSINVAIDICPPPAPVISANATCVAGPPSAPAVHVAWSSVPFATSYVVRKGGTPIATLPQDATSFDDVNVAINQTYSYTVTASNVQGSATSASAQATVANLPCIPNPPGSFAVSANAGCNGSEPVANVSWTASSGANSYVVNRNGTAVSPSLSASTAIFHDTTVASGQSYTYTVTATNGGGNTTSSPADVTVPVCDTLPSPFTATIAPFCAASSPAVHVSWTASTGATSYSVSRNGIPVSGTLSAGTLAYDDTTVTAGQTYTYSVAASNSVGNTTVPAGSITPSTNVCPPPAFTLTASATCNPIVSPPQSMVALNWTAAATATTYQILRDGAQIVSVSGNTTTFNDSPGAGTFSYLVRAVGPGGSTDSNTASVTVQPNLCSTPRPDLAAADISMPPAAAQPGDTFAVTIIVSDAAGSAAAPATTSRIRIGTGTTISPSDPIVATIATPPLAPGASTTQTATITLPNLPAGTYYLFLSVDDDQVAGDINPSNNVKRSAAITAQGPPCTLACAATVPSTAQAATPVVFALQRPPCANDRAVWTFGDSASATSYSPTHSYATAGTYHWTLTLTATTGESCSSSGNITITAPTVPPKRRAVHH
ncbi:MAG: PKD domain-containing protein [Acidobacteria bacterium]|nr:PKD domain-containing protein [Acidobacteriota bacterium]